MAKDKNAVVADAARNKLPAQMEADDGYEQYAGQGLGDVSQEDKGLPFYEVLQQMSPEIEQVEGAKAGMIINKSTKEIFDSIRFVPVCRQHVYTEWVPRDSGGGLAATYQITDPIVAEARAAQRVGKYVLQNGNELIETFYLYGLVLDDDDEPLPAVISFTSTKIAAYKQLTTRSDSLMFRTSDGRKLKYPWFAHVWRLGTEKKHKDKYTWYTWTVAFDSPDGKAIGAKINSDSPILAIASELYKAQKAGKVQMNTESLVNDDAVVEPNNTSGRSHPLPDDDEVPF